MESMITIGPQRHGGSIFFFLMEIYKRYRMNETDQSKLADAMEIYCDIVLKFKPNEAIRGPISPIVKIKKVPRLKQTSVNSMEHGFKRPTLLNTKSVVISTRVNVSCTQSSTMSA